MKFEWKGFNAAGKVLSGELDAASVEEAAGKLRAQSVFVSKCVPKGSPTTVAEEEPAPVPLVPPLLPDPLQPVTLNETNPAQEAMQSYLPDLTYNGLTPSKVSWQSLLEKDLKAIKEVCDFATEFGIPGEVISHAAADMIKEAMIAARMRA